MDTSHQVEAADEEFESFLEFTPALTQKRRSQGRIIFDRFMKNRAAVVGAVFLIVLAFVCFGSFLFWRVDPDIIDVSQIYMSPDLAHPFGTDYVGRDELARVLAGGRVSLLVALCSMIGTVALGVIIGAFAGYYGGMVDNILMRITDIFLSIPLYLLLFVLAVSFNTGTPIGVAILISALSWPAPARLVRGEFLALKEREFVMAARTVGARALRLMFRHILPNSAGPIIVSATLLVGNNIILESVLSYFNFGIHPPNPSWGNLVADGQNYFDNAPWIVFAPALFIFITVLCFNLVGDGLRDALDPQMTER